MLVKVNIDIINMGSKFNNFFEKMFNFVNFVLNEVYCKY